MPRYWFTTHYPPLSDGRDTLHVYLQDKHRDAANGISTGDRVFIYEHLAGPDLRRDGEIIARLHGKAAIVCEAKISTALYKRRMDGAREVYADGRDANYAWVAETAERTTGRLPRLRVNAIMGYKPGNRFHGFNSGRGIKELKPGIYQELLAAFLGR